MNGRSPRGSEDRTRKGVKWSREETSPGGDKREGLQEGGGSYSEAENTRGGEGLSVDGISGREFQERGLSVVTTKR